MNKLTPLQMLSVLICARFFSMMTYFPFAYNNAFIYMLGSLISTVIQAVLMIPVVMFGRRMINDNPCTLAVSKNKPVGYIVTVAYMVYFMISAFMVIGNFVYFMDYYFSGYIPRLIAVICIVLASVYLGQMKTGVIGKTAVVAGACFILLTIIVVAGSITDLKLYNFHLAENNIARPLWNAVKAEFARGDSLVIFAFLLPEIKSRDNRSGSECGKTIWMYLGIKIVVLEIILTLITVILGDYALVTKLPFFSLAAYSQTDLIERYDAAFLFVWVIITVVKLGLLLSCSGKCIRIYAPALNSMGAVTLSAIIPAVFSLFYLLPHKWESLAYKEGGSLWIVMLAIVIPTFMLLFVKKGGFTGEGGDDDVRKNGQKP